MDKENQVSIEHSHDRGRGVRLAAFADERGMSLVEILVSLAIMAIVFTAFLSALSTATVGVDAAREQVTAQNLARAQLEHVQEQKYITTTGYSLIDVPLAYSAYTLTVQSSEIIQGLQQITVTIYHNGPVFTIEKYKVGRESDDQG
jgi:prepilin-type N-terminal cleavage/methylation domain-containing protein